MKRKQIGVAEAQKLVLHIFATWSIMVASGMVMNMINFRGHNYCMPFWPWYDASQVTPVAWALQSWSHLFGDWIVIGNAYLWSIGDVLQIGSYPVLAISLVLLLLRYRLPIMAACALHLPKTAAE